MKTAYEAKGLKFQVESRQVVVGEALFSIVSVSLDEQAPAVSQIADQLALTIRPIAAFTR